MNSELGFIFARRSIRKYGDRPVPEALVRDMLEAGMAAPSAVCKDPWRFVVVRDRDTLREIADGLPNGKMLAEAAFGVVVAGDITAAHDGQLSYMLQDCSAAIENMLLAASALGLGACWLGVHPREERVTHLRRILNIPEQIIPISVLAVGWPAEEKPGRTRYSDANVCYESWGGANG
jgi:nitroreductase